MAIFYNKYLILLLSFFNPMIINIGGEVSPSFLFIFFTIPFWIRQQNFFNDKLLKSFVKLFAVIILVQLIWIPFAHTGFFTQFKGIMVTVSGLVHFLFYYLVIRKNPDVVKWFALGAFLSSFVFVNILAEIAGGEFGFWKFQVMPRIVSMAILIYLWFLDSAKMQKIAPLLLIFVGLLGIVTGARSTGLIPFIAGVLVMFLQIKRNIRLKKVGRIFIATVCLLYLAYAFFYVPNVLNGNISGGNSAQLKKVENPYNPLNLLILGRTDAIIPFIAFGDKPLTGWGYFTKDPDLKYHRMLVRMSSLEEIKQFTTEFDKNYYIPGHSVWGYYSCSYGIIVFVVIAYLIYKIWKFSCMSFFSKDRYLLYRVFIALSITWNMLFSPMPHFKTLPMQMAILLVLSMIAIGKSKSIKFSV